MCLNFGSYFKAYQAINIRMVLVGIEIQDGEQPFVRSVHAHHELGSFTDHFKNVIVKKKLSFLNIDNAIFFRYIYFCCFVFEIVAFF